MKLLNASNLHVERAVDALYLLLRDLDPRTMKLLEALLIFSFAGRGLVYLHPHHTFADAPAIYAYMARLPEWAWGTIYVAIGFFHLIAWRQNSVSGRCVACGLWMTAAALASAMMFVGSPYTPSWVRLLTDCVMSALCYLYLWLKLRNEKQMRKVADETGRSYKDVTELGERVLKAQYYGQRSSYTQQSYGHRRHSQRV